LRTEREAIFPEGGNLERREAHSAHPIAFSLTQHPPDNPIQHGHRTTTRGPFEAHASGRALVRFYGDLQHHDIGPALAGSLNAAGTGVLTEKTAKRSTSSATASYLQDGRHDARGGDPRPRR